MLHDSSIVCLEYFVDGIMHLRKRNLIILYHVLAGGDRWGILLNFMRQLFAEET